MRGKNSIEVGNRKSLLPLSSCYFCCIRKIFHSSSKNKSSTATELMKPSVFYDLPSFTFSFFPFFFLVKPSFSVFHIPVALSAGQKIYILLQVGMYAGGVLGG